MSIMSKTLLLELTPNEAELLQNSLLKEKSFWESKNSNMEGAAIERNLNTANLILSKIDDASRTKPDILINFNDLSLIKSNAITEYCKIKNNIKISNKEVEQKDFAHISLANSVFLWLNSKNLLKRFVGFDYTDDSSSYEGNGEY
jgi:hypothetical protein